MAWRRRRERTGDDPAGGSAEDVPDAARDDGSGGPPASTRAGSASSAADASSASAVGGSSASAAEGSSASAADGSPSSAPEGDDTTFDDQLELVGFRLHGRTRRGGRMWELTFNRFLTFVLHDYDDAVVLSWSFSLGDYVDERGWRSSLTDLSTAEIYPKHDVRLPLDIEAVGAEINRIRGSLRLDLGDPSL